MKIAAAQISCSLGNPDANLLKVRDFTARAKEAGANLIVFPEMVDIGYSMLVIRTNAASWTDGFVPELQDIAGKLSIAIVSGLSERDGVQNTRGAEFAPSFDTSRIAHVFHKGIDPKIDSYSTFFDNVHRRHTGLAHFLEKGGIEDIYLMGLALDYCVKYSALDARHLGLNTHVILDGCRGIELESGDIDRALDEMKRAGAILLTSTEL